jgi:DNA-binding transcriptional LysR family regulator
LDANTGRHSASYESRNALGPIRSRLCAAPDYLAREGVPQHAADLIDHDCLVFTTSGSRWEFQSSQGQVGVDVRPKLKTNDGVALCKAAVSGLGIAVLADYLASPAIAAGSLVEICPELKLPDIWLKALVPSSRYDLPRVQMLLLWLEQRLQLAG